MNSSTSTPLPASTGETSSQDSSMKQPEMSSSPSPLEEESLPETMRSAYWTLARTRLQSTPRRLEDLKSLTILRVTTVPKRWWSQSRRRGELLVGKPIPTMAGKKRAWTRLGGHTKRLKGELGKF